MSKEKKIDYQIKFDSFKNNTLFKNFNLTQQKFVEQISFRYHFTFQEFRQVVEAVSDFNMWQETDFEKWWVSKSNQNDKSGNNNKKQMLGDLYKYLDDLRSQPTKYPEQGLVKPLKRKTKKVVTKKSDKAIYGMCPVASPKTVCCNLRTIDAVENCSFGCSYCTIQTFYTDNAIFDAELEKKLSEIKLEKNRFYHFGSGQSSDSLAWGNRYKNLDILCNFAAKNPNILLEFKTKSDNISYFLENKIPINIVCSFSLNTKTVIENEEHFTASLDKRINAAKQLTDNGIKVAFHFHPMVYYLGWENDYPKIARHLLNNFKTDDVLFVSFGSVTLIKPVIQKIRQLGNPTKTLQMEFIQDPHGKFTYPDKIKIQMFKKMYNAFRPWQKDVLIYLCMEKPEIWRETFGFVYESNDQFEQDFGKQTMAKIYNNQN